MASARRRSGGEGGAAPVLAGIAAVAALFFVLPLAGLTLRAPWAEFTRRFGAAELEALRLSLVVSLGALGLSVALGAPLAWVLARGSWPGRRIVQTVVVLPMVLPPVVAGVGLLLALGRRGLLGGLLARAGVSLPFTTPAAVVAASFVSAPFLIVTLEAAFRSVDVRLENAAASLGANRFTILRTVTLPTVAPAGVEE